MKKEEYGKLSFSKTAKRVLVTTLALSMAVSGTAWASLVQKANNAKSEVKEEQALIMGDINRDGKVKLDDANLALKAALNIMTLTDERLMLADMNEDGKIKLDDANLVLKTALNIMPTRTVAPVTSKEPVNSEGPVNSDTPESASPVSNEPVTSTAPPIKTEKPSPTPTPTPKYVYPVKLPDVVADPSKAVTGTAFDIQDDTGATYYINERQIRFASPDAFGVQLVNPFVGNKELNVSVASATSLEAEPGKENVWTLSGASFTLKENEDFNIDGRINAQEDTSTCTYTRPDWPGITISFWEKATSTNYHLDPLLTMSNGRLFLTIRENGSLKFEDSNDSENFLELGSTNFVHGNYGEWNYYTVTIANDWIQVYVNGQENLYTNMVLSRKKIKKFNDGFLTRYNTAANITEEAVNNDPRLYLVKSGEWYYNSDLDSWTCHDNFTANGNARYRGANCGGKLISDLLTDEETMIYAGGADTTASFTTRQTLPSGAALAELTYYMSELTPEQIAANYSVATKPTDNPVYVSPTPSPTPIPDPDDATPTPRPTTDPYGGEIVDVQKMGNYASYNAKKNDIVFAEATSDAAEVDKIAGAQMVNPFANKSDLLAQTVTSALSGQSIFPWKDGNGYTYSTEGANKFRGGHDPYSVEVWRGNYYDKYYGDTNLYGNSVNIPDEKRPGIIANYISATAADIKTQEQLEAIYPEKEQTTYQVPKWSSGASVSFWAKPTEVDDSPLLTFYLNSNIALSMSVRGDICYYSLVSTDWTKGVKQNGEPKNTFATLGDAKMVKANEWNFYTLTLANDWIQVYINGKEMVYDFVNLNRTEIKGINGGYMTRYNTIGIWNTDLIAKNGGDPSGKTLDGRERNYLTKSGLFFDMHKASDGQNSPLSDKGPNSGRDGASRRSSSSYVNPFKGDAANTTTGGQMLMNLFSKKNVMMYIGGKSTPLDEGDYTFSGIKVDKTTDPTLVHYVPYGVDEKGVESINNYKKIYTTAHTLDAGTEVSTVKSYMRELKDTEVQTCYNNALADIASPGALEAK